MAGHNATVDMFDRHVAEGRAAKAAFIDAARTLSSPISPSGTSRPLSSGEWTRTGDKYTRGAGGFYRICGRTDDMFKVSGQWVSPVEVESAMITHPRVLECAIVLKEDSDGLPKPKAFIVLKGDGGKPGEVELQEHVKAQVGPWKYPRWIEFFDGLPKTATEKIQRFKLGD